MVNVTFYGVRGSTPCSGPDTARYGGNTACVTVERPGEAPIVLDLGTGLRTYGLQQADGPFACTAFVTHLHWDHVQGLPFFAPVLRPGSSLQVFGPRPELGGTLADAFGGFMTPPYFPVTVDQLHGDIRFSDLDDKDVVEIGSARVHARAVPHVGLTLGYRIEWDGVSVAYVSDHQQPADDSFEVDDAVLELCEGVDLLIHDAQYTVEEFQQKASWGHCTVEYAVHVARTAGARTLALFHHDPTHGDDRLDCLLGIARLLGGPDLEVVAAAEGTTVSLG
ncbi:MAG TPA: MBL fold metallo-hydrolase [Acidimicrobiales bacterium]|nr:MBL fold metallo-hydrolase [Acidimicrobiales bacterium]